MKSAPFCLFGKIEAKSKDKKKVQGPKANTSNNQKPDFKCREAIDDEENDLCDPIRWSGTAS